MDKLELSVGESKILKFQYSFSYILAKKIVFLSVNCDQITISNLIRVSPAIKVESKTKSGRTLTDNFHLTSYFTPYSINSIIDLKTNDIIIPEMNFKNSLSAPDYVVESKISFLCLDNSIRIFIVLEETPGVIDNDNIV